MFKMANRIILFLTLFMIFLGLLFLIGNVQKYQDDSLSYLSLCTECTAIGCIIFNAYAFVLMIIHIIKTRRLRYLFLIFYYIFSVLLSVIMITGSASIQFIQYLR